MSKNKIIAAINPYRNYMDNIAEIDYLEFDLESIGTKINDTLGEISFFKSKLRSDNPDIYVQRVEEYIGSLYDDILPLQFEEKKILDQIDILESANREYEQLDNFEENKKQNITYKGSRGR